MSRDVGGDEPALPSVVTLVVAGVVVALFLSLLQTGWERWTARDEAAMAEACSTEISLRRVVWWSTADGERFRCECVLEKERATYDCVCVSPAVEGGNDA